MKPRRQVRKELANTPLVEGLLGGGAPLYVEHYLFSDIQKTVSGFDGTTLLTLFGGRVREGESGDWRTTTLPSQSLLVPASCPTHWHYAGTVNFAVFYFPDRTAGITRRLELLAANTSEPLQFSDPLVSALALQLVKELHKGPGRDEQFMAMLAPVMLEQCYRAVTIPETAGFDPRHIHFNRLQAVLAYIREHLGGDLSVPMLASVAGVSVAHFRRLFREAMGTPPHRYVLATRLEQARTLLTLTLMPISQIAEECGFSSQSHFTACFRTVHASTPAEYRHHLHQSRSGE